MMLPVLLHAIVRLQLAATAAPAPPVIWEASGGSGNIAVDGQFGFNLSLTGAAWSLHSGGVALRCGGRRYSFPANASSPAAALEAVGSPVTTVGREQLPGRGKFSAVTQAWVAGKCALLSTTIRYFQAHDSFEFLTNVTSGAAGTAAAPPQNKPTATLATEFPVLLLRAGSSAPQVGSAWLPCAVTWGAGTIGPGEILLPTVSPDLAALGPIVNTDSGPVVFYSPSPSNSSEFGPAVALGLGNHFSSTGMSRTAAGALAAGASGYLATIPRGWTVSVGMTARRGVNSAALAWGEAARAQHGTARLSLAEDKLSSRLGYVQDDGGYYCFCEYTDRHLNNRSGFRPAGQTMTALKQYHEKLGLKLGVYHVDPYWYSRCPGDSREMLAVCCRRQSCEFHADCVIKELLSK